MPIFGPVPSIAQSATMPASYTVKLPQFEGPFDLLLYFIERDELDIHDIPIHSMTEEFLTYIRQMQELDIDLASEFILVAATLCRIKAKLLIPRKQIDEEGNEIDPREELVQRLLEYKRYKSVLEDLRKLEAERARRTERGNATKELRHLSTKALVDAELESLTLYKLLRTFERVMLRYEDNSRRKTVHRIMNYSYTIKSQREYLVTSLQGRGKSSFKQVFGNLENRIHAIVTFLALLELLNMQEVELIQGGGVNEFYLALA